MKHFEYKNKATPEEFITTLNNVCCVKDVFTNGYCYHFAAILNDLFDGYVVYNPVLNHFAFLDYESRKIYDITGAIGDCDDDGWVAWNSYISFEPIESNRIINQCIYKGGE